MAYQQAFPVNPTASTASSVPAIISSQRVMALSIISGCSRAPPWPPQSPSKAGWNFLKRRRLSLNSSMEVDSSPYTRVLRLHASPEYTTRRSLSRNTTVPRVWPGTAMTSSFTPPRSKISPSFMGRVFTGPGTVTSESFGSVGKGANMAPLLAKPRRISISLCAYISQMSSGARYTSLYSKSAPIWSTWPWVFTRVTGSSVSSRTKALRLPTPDRPSIRRAFSLPSRRKACSPPRPVIRVTLSYILRALKNFDSYMAFISPFPQKIRQPLSLSPPASVSSADTPRGSGA